MQKGFGATWPIPSWTERYDWDVTVGLAELLTIAVVAVLLGAALVYLLGSFFLMAKHVSNRPG